MQTDSKQQSQDPISLRIILIEEHPAAREALSQTLMRHLERLTVWTTPYLPTDAEEYIDFEPNVILVGLPQQAIASLETLLDQIKVWVAHGIKVVTLTTYINLDEVVALRKAGVFAMLLKTAGAADMIQTIQQAAESNIKEKSDV